MQKMLIRAATQGDVHAIVALQRECYAPELVESDAVFRSIVAFGMSWVAVSHKNVVVGYALVHPAADPTDVPALHAPIPAVHDVALREEVGEEGVTTTVLFVHDLTVGKAARRAGVGSALARRSCSSSSRRRGSSR
jgi:predicted N-acetyltransferase YhbS